MSYQIQKLKNQMDMITLHRPFLTTKKIQSDMVQAEQWWRKLYSLGTPS
jgi:hypothetical protein